MIAAIGILLLLAGYLCLYTAGRGLGVAWGAARGLSLLWWAPVLWVALGSGANLHHQRLPLGTAG